MQHQSICIAKQDSFIQFRSQTESLHFLRQIGRLLEAVEDLTVAGCTQRLTTYTATEPQNTTLACHMLIAIWILTVNCNFTIIVLAIM
jgi:hypothetical protein